MTPADPGSIRSIVRPLRGPADLDPLLERIGNARVVAVGEASHGTHEYHAWRAALTRRLVEERGFALVAVEGDWPDCDRVDRSVRLRPGGAEDPRQAPDAFARWPTWMWADEEVVDFCRWLRSYDSGRPAPERVGFYGLDVHTESWHVRDRHMADTLDRLLEHTGGKAVVWEHDTHVGGARATDMAGHRMVDVGQLLRERHGTDDVVLVGFGGKRGSVVAGSEWGAQLESMPVPPARAGSLEALLHAEVGQDALFVVPAGDRPSWLSRRTDHRAIGVVHRPERERWGNDVPTVLGERCDAFLYLDETTALRPLHLERPGEDLPLGEAI